MMYPVEIQVISCTVEPSDPIMCGMATLTMDESMAPISVPKVIDSVMSHLFGFGRARRSGGRAASSVMLVAMLRPLWLEAPMPSRAAGCGGGPFHFCKLPFRLLLRS